MADIEQAIKDYIVKEFMFDKPGEPLRDDSALIQEGIIDSLGIFVLVAFIEKQFGIKVAPEDVVIENFATIAAIKSLVVARLPSGRSI